MTRFTLFFAFTIVANFVFADEAIHAPLGRLICWNAKNETAIIPGYQGALNVFKNNSSSKDFDYNGRRSFEFNFEEIPPASNGLIKDKRAVYVWSYSECEDSSEISFNEEQLKKVLNGEARTVTGIYAAEYAASSEDEKNPDANIDEEWTAKPNIKLTCKKLNTRNHGRPVFALP